MARTPILVGLPRMLLLLLLCLSPGVVALADMASPQLSMLTVWTRFVLHDAPGCMLVPACTYIIPTEAQSRRP